MSPATVHTLADVARAPDLTTDERLVAVAERFEEVATRLEDGVAELRTEVRVLSEQTGKDSVYAQRAAGAARRAEEAADRAGSLSVDDVQRIAAEVSTRLERPVAKAQRAGVAKGVGSTLAGTSLLLAGGFAADPVAFVEAFTRIFGG